MMNGKYTGRAFAAVLLLIVGAATAYAQKKEKTDWANFKRYAAENEAVRKASPDTCRIVMMGNSITQLWAERHPDFFTENHMIGRGISGHTSYQMLSRFRQDVINLRPECVVITAGTNDVAEVTHPFNPDMTMDNIATMVELARLHGITPVITTILPGAVWEWMHIDDAPQRIDLLNARIRRYAAENNVIIADYYPATANPDGTFREGMTYDNIHPTAEGYAAMRGILLPAIAKARKR